MKKEYDLSDAPRIAAKYLFHKNGAWPTPKELKSFLHENGIISMGPGEEATLRMMEENIEEAIKEMEEEK